MEKKININSNKYDNKNFKYIYFIINYDKSKQLKVYLSPKYKCSDTLEKINDKPYIAENGLFTSDEYRFKIIEDDFIQQKGQKEFQISVNVESGNEKYQYVIKIKDFKKDFYEYKFEIRELDVLILDYQKQFEIYHIG